MTRLSSMTGFARVERRSEEFACVWELKSVNGRTLDFRCRLPPGQDALEVALKSRTIARLGRGTVTANLTITETKRQAALRINETVLAQMLALLENLGAASRIDPPRLDGLLALPGVIDVDKPLQDEAQQEQRTALILDAFEAALAGLVEARQVEGTQLAAILAGRLGEIETLINLAHQSAALQPAAIRERFSANLAKVMDARLPVSEDRLAQEVALLVQRADVREELDRLNAHVAAARTLLAEAAAVGRKLDFLCQEFNREANTICSKSADLGLTRIGLDLKASIEQFREQVQNVE